jgi:hypothetical protein
MPRGDQLLIMVANRLRVVVTAEISESVCRRPLLARLAGDEFTLFFAEIQSAADVERVARRIALAISEPFELYGHSVDIGASIGVALSPDHGNSIESLMRAADIAMYRAKELGGGQHCLFDDDLAASHQRKIDTEKALTEAVQRGEFVLAYQPQLSLVTASLSEPRRSCAGIIRAKGCACRQLHSGRRKHRPHLGDRRLGHRRGRRHSGHWHRDGLTVGSRSMSARASSTERTSSRGCARLQEHGVPLSLVELEIHRDGRDEGQRKRSSRKSPRFGGWSPNLDRRFRNGLFEPRQASQPSDRSREARSIADRGHRESEKARLSSRR